MRRAYGLDAARPGHHITDAQVALVAFCLVSGVWLGVGSTLGVAVLALVGTVLIAGGHVLTAMVTIAALVGGAVRSDRDWAGAHLRHADSYTGWAQVVADPAVYGSGLRLTVEIDGERLDTWLYGALRNRPSQVQSGEYVWVQGDRRPMRSGARRAALRHVMGRLQADVVADVDPGSALTRASNRLRRRLRGAAEAAMPAADSALFTGLVLGDDAREPVWLVDDFRRSGLSHLTAVSGQNVGFLLLAALPLLRRLRPWWRWAATVGLIGWFMALTRFEPSVLRAGVMAVLAATAHVRGRQATPVRLLSLAVGWLVLVDPFLVWSVGFWLSVAATAGVCLAGPWLFSRLPGPAWLRLPLSITLGAQAGVALPSLLVFHRLPLVTVPANIAAVPVAGLVMLYGIPSALIAPVLPSALGRLLMLPNVVGTRWVATVAQVAGQLEPSPGWGALGWGSLTAGVCVHYLVVRRRSRTGRAGVPF